MKSLQTLFGVFGNVNNTGKMGDNQEARSHNKLLAPKAPDNFQVPAYPQDIEERINQRREDRDRLAELERNKPKQYKPVEKKKKYIPNIPYKKQDHSATNDFCERAKELPDAAKKVLNYFLKIDQALPRIYTAQSTIASHPEVQYSVRHVQRQLNILSKEGFISFDKAPDKITCEYFVSPVFKLQEVQNRLYKHLDALTYKFMQLVKPIMLSLLFGASYKLAAQERGPYVDVPIALKRIVYPSIPSQMSYNSKELFIKKLTCSTPPSTERGLGAREGAPTSLVDSLLAKFTAPKTPEPQPVTNCHELESKQPQQALVQSRFGIKSVSDPKAYMDDMADILSALASKCVQNSSKRDGNSRGID
jgi:hypothetical protein